MKPSPIAERIERRAGNPRQQSAAKTDPPIPILSRFRFQNSLKRVLGGAPDHSSYPSMIVCVYGKDVVDTPRAGQRRYVLIESLGSQLETLDRRQIGKNGFGEVIDRRRDRSPFVFAEGAIAESW